MPNPYITSFQQSQDVSGLQPVYQNMAAQQQYQNQAIAQGNQLAQQAGQPASMGGFDPMKMAAALRGNGDGVSPLQNAQAYFNSKFGRDPLQPDTGMAAQSAQQFYGNTYNPDAGWSS